MVLLDHTMLSTLIHQLDGRRNPRKMKQNLILKLSNAQSEALSRLYDVTYDRFQDYGSLLPMILPYNRVYLKSKKQAEALYNEISDASSILCAVEPRDS